RDDLSVAMVNKLTTADAAVRTDRTRDVRAGRFRLQHQRAAGHRLRPGAVGTIADLAYERPFQQEFGEHMLRSMQEPGAPPKHQSEWVPGAIRRLGQPSFPPPLRCGENDGYE